MKLHEIASAPDRLDRMIQGVLQRYGHELPKNASLELIRALVAYDYVDSDISKVTPHDIVEIIDASTQHVDGRDVLVAPPSRRQV